MGCRVINPKKQGENINWKVQKHEFYSQKNKVRKHEFVSGVIINTEIP